MCRSGRMRFRGNGARSRCSATIARSSRPPAGRPSGRARARCPGLLVSISLGRHRRWGKFQPVFRLQSGCDAFRMTACFPLAYPLPRGRAERHGAGTLKKSPRRIGENVAGDCRSDKRREPAKNAGCREAASSANCFNSFPANCSRSQRQSGAPPRVAIWQR